MTETTKRSTILIVDDQERNVELLKAVCENMGHDTLSASNSLEALEKANEYVPDLILMDVIMPGMDGFEATEKIKNNELTKHIPIIIVTALSSREDRITGISKGADDFLTKPIDPEEVILRVRNNLKIKKYLDLLTVYYIILETQVEARTAELKESFDEISRLKEQLEAENVYLREEITRTDEFKEIVGDSQVIKDVLRNVDKVAQTDSTVLITGETGTGKELISHAIHKSSKRKNKLMVKINCATMPSTLIESELFGRDKGAYTGALTTQIGRFELADKGTIFLDEIGELPLELQAKLLRVLHDGEFERLGSTKTMKVDVRVIAATNRDLEKAVEEGKFRSDLYYRLNVFPIHVPPLRERKEDILPLAWFFIKKLEKKMGKKIKSISKQKIKSLQGYSWPGNIRELLNVLERSMIMTTDSTLRLETPTEEKRTKPREATLQNIEKDHIVSVLQKTGWRIRGNNGAANILGLKPTTLEARIKKLGIKH